MSATLRAELIWDEEAENWHFRVPALHLNGGGNPSREEAQRACLDAIAFALEGDPADYDPQAMALSLDVSVVPASRDTGGTVVWMPRHRVRHIRVALGRGPTAPVSPKGVASPERDDPPYGYPGHVPGIHRTQQPPSTNDAITDCDLKSPNSSALMPDTPTSTRPPGRRTA